MRIGDLNMIDVQWIIQYHIDDPGLYPFQIRNTFKNIRDATAATMRRDVSNRLDSNMLTACWSAVPSDV